MTEPLGEHEVERLLRRGLGAERARFAGHPRIDGVAGCIEVGRERADDVALGEDAEERLAVEDERRTHVMDTHEVCGLRDGRVRSDRGERRCS